MNMQEAITSFEEYIRSEELVADDFVMPKHKIVCTRCNGEGTHGPGWVFTEEDRYEMGYEFDEMMDEMRRGSYNVTCETCGGRNVIDELDEDRLTDELKKKWHWWLAEIQEMEDIQRMERMMGA